MAVTHRNFDSLEQRQDKKFDINNLPYPVCLIFGLLSVFLLDIVIALKLYLLAIPLIVIIVILCRRMLEILKGSKEEKIIKSGAEGERRALTQLQCLDHRYHIIPNAILCYGEKRSEMDMIVVGPTGIFIVEVKNHKGIISGNTADHDFKQIKNEESHYFYNPCKQVATHRYTLNGVLQERKGIHEHIYTCVYFCNDDVSLQIENDPSVDCTVISNCDELLSYIKNQPVRFRVDEEVKEIVRCIIGE